MYADKKDNTQCQNTKKITDPDSVWPQPYLRVLSPDMSEGPSFFLRAYMGKDPAFLFYSADFLIGTSFFTNSEVGDYIRILCHMHQVGGHMAPHEVAHVAPHASERVLKKFKKNEDGLYYHTRLLMEMQRRQAYTDSRLKNLSSHMGRHMDNHMETETETDNKDKKEGIVKGRPTLEEVASYFSDLNFSQEAEKFFDYFASNGWKVGGKAKMKDWKAAARNWVRRASEPTPVKNQPPPGLRESERVKQWENEASPPPEEFKNLINDLAAKKAVS